MEKLTPRAVIFDLGCTLIEYEAVPWETQSVSCSEYGRRFLIEKGYSVPPEKEFFSELESAKSGFRRKADTEFIEWDVTMAARVLFDRHGWETEGGMLDGFFDAYYSPYHELLYIYEDTIDVLSRLKSAGYAVGLISNTVFPERAHRHELERFKIAPLLDFTIFSSTFGLRKPHPEIFHRAAHLAGAGPRECVYVGDRYKEDITGPSSVGMPAILKVKPGRDYPTEMPDSTRKVNTLSELVHHLDF